MNETSLRGVVAQITNENPESTLRIVDTFCGYCGELFPSPAIMVSGRLFVDDKCLSCHEEERKGLTTCVDCGGRVYFTVTPGGGEEGAYCPKCTGVDAQAEAQHLERARSRWQQITPREYQNTQRDRLPCPALYDRVLQWKFGGRGLLLCGDTGLGKTRSMYDLCRRLTLEGKRVQVYRSDEFSNSASAQFSEAARGKAWADSLLLPDVLILDDFGKGVFTDRVSSVLFGVVEGRTSRRLPLILTTNDTETVLREKMRDAGTAGALLRRFNEFCEVINFQKGGRK